MSVAQLESLAIEVCDRVARGLKVEDSRIELKRDWPVDSTKAARRLAGHCNAIANEDAIWIIGVDEKQGAAGCIPADLADWWPKVQKEFDELSPTLLEHVVVAGLKQPVVALRFSTERAPFLVRNPDFAGEKKSPIEREVPWRDGTRVRTARRQDLLRLLASRQRTPRVEVVQAELQPIRSAVQNLGGPVNYVRDVWELFVEIAVIPQDATKLAFLAHRSTLDIALSKFADKLSIDPLKVTLGPAEHQNRQSKIVDANARVEGSLIAIWGPATLTLWWVFRFPSEVAALGTAEGRALIAGAEGQSDIAFDFSCDAWSPTR